MYMEMMSLLDQYEKDIYSKWCDGLENACLINLNQPLLTRNTLSGLIAVNFNPKVINVMFSQSQCYSLSVLFFFNKLQTDLRCIKVIILAVALAICYNHLI